MTYLQAKAQKAAFEMEHDLATIRLRLVSGEQRGPMGLTPDHVKSTSEWKVAFTAERQAFRRMADYNRIFMKQFGKQYVQELKAKLEEKLRKI